MAVHVCLLRAVGPATHPLMSMAALRAALDAARLPGAVTVGNTGNVILRSRLKANSVRGRIQGVVDGFGVRCEVFTRSLGEVEALLAANPFPHAAAETPRALGVCFFHAAPHWPPHDGPEGVAVVGNHLVVDYHGRTEGSGLPIERRSGATMTQRSWSSLLKIAARARAFASPEGA